MRRREFIGLLGGAAAWPLAVHGQQKAGPTIGLLGCTSADESTRVLDALRAGLKESGFVENQNVRIEYRWAHGRHGRLPALARDLVNDQAVVIVTTGGEPSALAAKAATSKIPIVFVIDGDPVIIGLVDSLNNPGGNATGLSLISPALEAKRLGLLRELVSKSALIGVLANEDYPDTDRQLAGVETAAEELGQKVSIQNIRSERDLDRVFTTLSHLKVDALLVAADPLFTELNDQIVALATRYRIPAVYASREFVVAGGCYELWRERSGCVSGSGTLCREDSQRCQGRRFAGAVADQVRPGDQPQGREVARPHRAAVTDCPRRRGDRITINLLRCMSPLVALSRHRRVRCKLSGQCRHDLLRAFVLVFAIATGIWITY
jgi:putative ABC transport system substrate-binding protein